MKDSKNVIIGALLITLMVMAVGYAAFATQLTINGNATIKGEWDVEITDITPTYTGTAKEKDKDDNGTAGAPTYTKTSATFDAELYAPGDTATYVVTIENKGNITAKLSSATWTEGANGSTAIVYTTTDPAAELAPGATTTATVVVTYKSDVTELPEVLTKKITGVFDYVQK